MTIISRDYFIRNDTLWMARDLIGKYLCTRLNGNTVTAGIITETEAYLGSVDRASHAYGNRRTARTNTMFMAGGIAYVYLCYGIHHLFNIVTNTENIPHAILIRGIFPVDGLEIMEQRIQKKLPLHLNGPGKLTLALGIKTLHDATSLEGGTIWLEDRSLLIDPKLVKTTPRIGVDYAGEDASLPWRFVLDNVDCLKRVDP
ncbi:MAG: DNA-3-methyladenine glycosylase [Bacteroidota bacterium]